MSAAHIRVALPSVAAAACAVHAAPALAARSAALRGRLGVRDRVDDERTVALTFDDGPHPHGTPATLDTLAEAGATATFFLVGEQVLRHPALAAEIGAAGHEIALHCHRHRNLLRLVPGQVQADLLQAQEAIIHATGCVPRLYRPPYGVLTAAALTNARRLSCSPVLWTRWGRDWRASATAATIAAEAARNLEGGEIVLLHDADHYSADGSWRATVRALPRIFALIEHAGLRPGSIP